MPSKQMFREDRSRNQRTRRVVAEHSAYLSEFGRDPALVKINLLHLATRRDHAAR